MLESALLVADQKILARFAGPIFAINLCVSSLPVGMVFLSWSLSRTIDASLAIFLASYSLSLITAGIGVIEATKHKRGDDAKSERALHTLGVFAIVHFLALSLSCCGNMLLAVGS